MNFSVHNLGCKVNRVEADGFVQALFQAGHRISPSREADFIIVNTCTVTAGAEKKARKEVHRALRANGTAQVIVTGCAAAINGEMFTSMDKRVRVIDRAALQNYVDGLQAAHGQPCVLKKDRTRVGLKIQDGCDQNCTYCIVCVARGKSRSVDPHEVLTKAKDLVRQGIKEIVLTGINLGAYNAKGEHGNLDLVALLNRLLELAAPANVARNDNGPPLRFRLSSIEPMNINDEIIELLASAEGALCRHLHLPLQSGSSAVLDAMNRPYRAEDYRDLIKRLRQHIPTLSLSTDIIVGFPGETEVDFEQTLELAQEAGFSGIHIFPYSRREGTPAAAWDNQVSETVKAERARQLRTLARKLRAHDYAKRASTMEWVLVEKPGRARSESYYPVTVDKSLQPGSLVYVRLPEQPLNSKV